MSAFEIYDNTRCCWKVNKEQADKVDYAFSIYDGMVIEVFKIVQWLPAHSTLKNVTTLEPRPDKDVGRYEFVGNIAPNVIREKYVGKMVHIAKLNGRICGAKRSHSVSEQPNCYQSV